MASRLAIIIPAYKAEFFSQTLSSLADQTCKDFHLYVGDDASPYNLKSLLEPFKNRIDLKYHRFDSNMGKDSLSRQWDRCIRLSNNEEFVWLFSDDDVLPQDAVERFFSFQNEFPKFDIYRFNIQLIDHSNKLITEATCHQAIEPVEDFIENRLLGKTHSSVVEYIFTRKAYQKINGFVEFPLAWASDDATWICMGQEKGIATIQGSPVSWRISGQNITSQQSNNQTKFRSMLLFYRWILDNGFGTGLTAKQLSTGVTRQARILRITLITYLKHFRQLTRLIGLVETFRLGNTTLKRNVKKWIY